MMEVLTCCGKIRQTSETECRPGLHKVLIERTATRKTKKIHDLRPAAA